MEFSWEIDGHDLVAQVAGFSSPVARWDVSEIDHRHALGLMNLLEVNSDLSRVLIAGFHGLQITQLQGLGVPAA